MDEHPLIPWIDKNRPSRAAFAREIGTSQTHLHHILNFERGMSLQLAVNIELATRKKFTAARLQTLQAERLSRGKVTESAA